MYLRHPPTLSHMDSFEATEFGQAASNMPPHHQMLTACAFAASSALAVFGPYTPFARLCSHIAIFVDVFVLIRATQAEMPIFCLRSIQEMVVYNFNDCYSKWKLRPANLSIWIVGRFSVFFLLLLRIIIIIVYAAALGQRAKKKPSWWLGCNRKTAAQKTHEWIDHRFYLSLGPN